MDFFQLPIEGSNSRKLLFGKQICDIFEAHEKNQTEIFSSSQFDKIQDVICKLDDSK